MCHKATFVRVWLAAGLGLQVLVAQTNGLPLEWRRIGNTTLDLNLAGPATGPVERAWFANDGSRLFVTTASRRSYQTVDFEHWQLFSGQQLSSQTPASPLPANLPETGARVQSAFGQPGRLYAIGQFAWRSDDGGVSWTNLTAFKGNSILGNGLTGLAVSPTDANDLVVTGSRGVWRSLDGGLTWSGLNDSLPNLPVRRLLHVPDGRNGLRIALGMDVTQAEWRSGDKGAWQTVADSAAQTETLLVNRLSQQLGAVITATAIAGDSIYAGSADGRLWGSVDRGQTWKGPSDAANAPVQSIFVDPKDPQFALAALGGNAASRVERTLNAGGFWDDLTSNLPAGNVSGITADRNSGAVYVAADAGVFMTYNDLHVLSNATPWTLVKPGPDGAPAMDVALDPAGNQLFAAFDGAGVFATIAPHRFRYPSVVSAGDMTVRPAAPGALLSVLGSRIQSARTGDLTAPVLAASDTQSQIQVPFEASGSSLSLSMESVNGRVTLGLPLQNVSPSLLVDRDGSPLLLNADTGLLYGAATPARSGSRLQILATGLGRVTPDWPTGMAAPLENPSKVVIPVRVYLNKEPLEVTRATLAPGYVGFYLIEVQLPAIVNIGTAELYVEADGHPSNHVLLYLEQ